MNARQELNRRVAAFADSSAPEGVTVALYGSVARGDSTKTSDVDLLVVFPDEVALDDRDEFVTGLRDNVQLWTGNDAQIYDLTESSLTRQKEDGDPIVDSWASEGIVVFGNSTLGMRKAP
ncbi:putative nucleotidyltransferase [Cryobacterium sp. MP_M5]|uniref:nucleotidyltransferase domain-containing protein n=1 Tax=unclassified Cryobacterium TaxID=2649013 RepID=UPI0018C9D3E8|nr:MULTISPECIES: nucleotidyltransferase domain-containing protein [unclassified Cryobacterium]MBG6060038.1 putative nucleotidyltransferase [Cryobacterium sp. MP_M3]MEC5178440.1 putative nucleotidyltransferase [Cryobacterium sp. MP_M5]